MKQSIIIMLLILVGLLFIYFAHAFVNRGECGTNADCLTKIQCTNPEKPVCSSFINAVTGEKRPNPVCVCRNPDYDY